MSYSMDTCFALEELSKQAAQYSINLSGKVGLDKQNGALQGRSNLVYPGVLSQKGVKGRGSRCRSCT